MLAEKETKGRKAERNQNLAELRDLEALPFALGLAVGPRWLGRKSAAKHPKLD
jgi:hypothetical protein